jgi:hypothetical protein
MNLLSGTKSSCSAQPRNRNPLSTLALSPGTQLYALIGLACLLNAALASVVMAEENDQRGTGQLTLAQAATPQELKFFKDLWVPNVPFPTGAPDIEESIAEQLESAIRWIIRDTGLEHASEVGPVSVQLISIGDFSQLPDGVRHVGELERRRTSQRSVVPFAWLRVDSPEVPPSITALLVVTVLAENGEREVLVVRRRFTFKTDRWVEGDANVQSL